ncbi:uncharacterized protein LTR77_000039 [Saxophila tyrrhenica]|uniref:Uncharacterized protein n=1 Tax=Saxophila tyrrhenica TaxID=1690608 RepID=A0AAV9PNL8_9PEZI|nr:hypothetical protein LTR77_000039 [Saxophila tyrrhenica]
MAVNNNGLASNNPFAQQSNGHPEQQLAKEQQQSLDSEKQVLSSEGCTGPGNAPMVVPEVQSLNSPIPVDEPEREAGKEVTSSWQILSKEESSPISMAYHESRPQQSSGFVNDVKGPPPSYESLNGQSRSGSDGLATPSPLEPDDATSKLPPKQEDRTTVGQLLSWIPPAPRIPPSQMPPLVQPIVIPQLDVPPQGESVPFTRCYSEALASHDVSMRNFLSFLDGLALAQAPNSALQGLKLFGVGVNSIPLPIIPLAGRGISALATSGSGHSSSRARLYLERAKKEFFAPRGLNMTIVKDGDLSARLQIPTHVSRLAPLTKNSLTETCCQRRTNGLAPYVAPLRFNVPEPDKQLQGVHKMARKHLESKFKAQAKHISRLRERQWEDISSLGPEMRGWEEQYAFKMGQLRRVQDDLLEDQGKFTGDKPRGELRERIQALEELQRQVQLMESQRYTAVMNAVGSRGKGVEAEMEEVGLSRKLKWIVIESL